MNVDLKAILDEARASLVEPDMRSPLMNFTSSVHAPRVTASPGVAAWVIDAHDHNVRFSLKKADKQGQLAVFTHFLWYGFDDTGRVQRCGALTTTPVRLSEDGRSAIAIGQPVKNQLLLDLVAKHGVIIDEIDGVFSVRPGSRGTAILEGDARIASLPALSMKPHRYLQHTAFPAILENRLLRSFLAPADWPERPDAWLVDSPVTDRLGQITASDGADAVAPSERRPEAGESHGTDLDPDQRRAVEMALTATAMIVDGPPGTGKSAIITSIAERAIRAGRSVMLTSTERSALEVGRRRLTALGLASQITIGTPTEIAASPPATVGIPDHDILMIDECSRMPLTVAMPLLTRARAVIVIGDDKQLRPDHPGETILDRATSLGLPRTTLRFHYRSRDRSLISPSNIFAYGMLLRTAPSPGLVPTDGIRLVDLPEGKTESMGQGAVNRAEAEAIAAKVAELRAAGDPRSIGIVSANQAQKLLIERLIGRAKGAPGSDEPLFVRAVQDAQGEERDIILVTTVYDGRDLRDRFGLFDKPGSVERLNVMLSRSRSEMWIYTSFRRSTPRIKAQPSRGRITYEAMRTILDVMTQAELRLSSPTALHQAARQLGMSVDNLGTVYGFRYRGDPAYRVGLIAIDNSKGADHWTAIETQLRAIGWLTLRMDEKDIKVKPASIVPAIQAAMSTASNSIERSRS